MGYQVNFAGNQLEDYCKVLNVSRDILPQRDNFSKSVPSKHGSFYTGYQYADRTIALEIAIVAISREDRMNKIRKLADVLNVTSPSYLEISDEPTRYCYAVPNGAVDIEYLFLTGTATIQFICHDIYSYSKDYKVFTPIGNKITVENKGTAEAKPIIEVDFQNSACFFQVTNPRRETVLIGKPKDETISTTHLTDVILNEDCTSATKFGAMATTQLDFNRLDGGTYGVGLNGNAIVCTNYGSSSASGSWIGAPFKRNIGQNVGEFEVKIDLSFGSGVVKYVVPPTPTVPNPVNPTEKTYGTYQVVNCGGLWINREANTKYPLYAMSPNTKIYPTEIKGNWAKHTHKTKYGTYTGWSSLSYLKKISDTQARMIDEDNVSLQASSTSTAEDELGIIEMYGFDQNGGKLFTATIADGNKYYEHVRLSANIGGKEVLHDGNNAPNAKTTTSTDESGKSTTTEIASGSWGSWNDFDGNVVIKREKNSAGKYLWNVAFNKMENGKVVRTLSTSNSLCSDTFSSNDLNYLGFYIGKFGANTTMTTAGIKNIQVRKLNTATDSISTSNTTIFEAGDHLQIDFNNGLVTLNSQPYLTHIDIGSEFFDIPSGRSQIAVATDDEEAVVLCGIQEKFL